MQKTIRDKSDWPFVLRVVFTHGGIVVVSPPQEVLEVRLGLGGSIIYRFDVEEFGHLYSAVRRMGLSLVGTTFVQHQQQLQGLRPGEFRAVGPGSGWPTREAQQKWRNIAFAASKKGQPQLLDISARLAAGLLHAESRLKDLGKAYSVQLRGSTEAGAKQYALFRDMNSLEVYKAIHALFWELAVLRDSIAEFSARFCFSMGDVTTMKRLRDSLLKIQGDHALKSQLIEATNPVGGWIATFTSYRNFFTHQAPLEQATHAAMAVQDMRELDNGLSVPQIYYPLPADIERLKQLRSKGVLPTPAEPVRHDREKEPDALKYLHDSLNLFVGLSESLMSFSPLPPTPIVLGQEDLRH